MLLDNMTKYLNVLLRSEGAHSGPRHRHVIDVLRYVLLSRMAWSGVSHLLYDNCQTRGPPQARCPGWPGLDILQTSSRASTRR